MLDIKVFMVAVKKVFHILVLFILIGSMAVILYFGFHLIFDKKLITTYYSIEKNIENPIRIVQLTDLHDAEFGSDNKLLIHTVEEQSPDIIVMTGDMINEDDADTSVVENLVKELVKVAPVYYGYGNHESQWDQTIGQDKETSIRDIITSCGATVLECDFKDIEINGVPVRIAGYMSYYRNPVMKTQDKEIWQREKQFFDGFEETDRFKILLNHIPTAWLEWDGINFDGSNVSEGEYDVYGHADKGFDVDLVFCGHYHGGQWVLPIIGPVYNPYDGFDTEYSKGLFIGSKAACVLSSGLGNEYKYIPRINNSPEIVVVDVM